MNPIPTPLASTAMEAARELSNDHTDTLRGLGHSVTPHDYVSKTEEYFTLLQKHFQPLLAKVEGEPPAKDHVPFSNAELVSQVLALRASLASVQGERDGLKRDLDKRLEDYLNERVCCTGDNCGCMGATRIQELIAQEAYASLTALRADLAAKEAAWQPIDTADPKKCVLLFQPAGEGRMPLAARIIVDAPISCHHRKPTHWMPLPAHPSALASRADKGGAR